mmetsp:Transcript_26154/g.70783  ORF Transcript_26154/g.70783 Transcript_26154/m.70783 type:complete len:203 (-) Transcript_26154:132-740(-)
MQQPKFLPSGWPPLMHTLWLHTPSCCLLCLLRVIKLPWLLKLPELRPGSCCLDDGRSGDDASCRANGVALLSTSTSELLLLRIQGGGMGLSSWVWPSGRSCRGKVDPGALAGHSAAAGLSRPEQGKQGVLLPQAVAEGAVPRPAGTRQSSCWPPPSVLPRLAVPLLPCSTAASASAAATAANARSCAAILLLANAARLPVAP